MNKHLDRLLKISQKNERLIVGLMSGTSLDGLDLALCKISGSGRATSLNVIQFVTWEYPEELRERLKTVASKKEVNQKDLAILNCELGDLYAEQVEKALQEWGIQSSSVDLIACHGQTSYHAPVSYTFNSSNRSATFQIVDADHISEKTGIITISDFRQKHTAKGGEGAPLAAIFDEYLFQHPEKNRILLNLGGIANFTYLPAIKSGGEIMSSDTGPANTLINQAMLNYFDVPYDEGGRKAAEGLLDEYLLKSLKDHSFFKRSFPKTTGPEEFELAKIVNLHEINEIYNELTSLIVTLTQLTIDSVTDAIKLVSKDEMIDVYTSGGGFHNRMMMDGIAGKLPNATCYPFEELGIPGDAKEAAMMAFFANELIMGSEFELGKISLP